MKLFLGGCSILFLVLKPTTKAICFVIENHYFSSEIIIIRNNDIYQSYNMNEIPAITGKICPDPLITRNTNSFKCN